MTSSTNCCPKCRCEWSEIGNQYACLSLSCECHTQPAKEEKFCGCNTPVEKLYPHAGTALCGNCGLPIADFTSANVEGLYAALTPKPTSKTSEAIYRTSEAEEKRIAEAFTVAPPKDKTSEEVDDWDEFADKYNIGEKAKLAAKSFISRLLKETAAQERQKGRDEAVDYILGKLPEPTEFAPNIESIRNLIEAARSSEEGKV